MLGETTSSSTETEAETETETVTESATTITESAATTAARIPVCALPGEPSLSMGDEPDSPSSDTDNDDDIATSMNMVDERNQQVLQKKTEEKKIESTWTPPNSLKVYFLDVEGQIINDSEFQQESDLESSILYSSTDMNDCIWEQSAPQLVIQAGQYRWNLWKNDILKASTPPKGEHEMKLLDCSTEIPFRVVVDIGVQTSQEITVMFVTFTPHKNLPKVPPKTNTNRSLGTIEYLEKNNRSTVYRAQCLPFGRIKYQGEMLELTHWLSSMQARAIYSNRMNF